MCPPRTYIIFSSALLPDNIGRPGNLSDVVQVKTRVVPFRRIDERGGREMVSSSRNPRRPPFFPSTPWRRSFHGRSALINNVSAH